MASKDTSRVAVSDLLLARSGSLLREHMRSHWLAPDAQVLAPLVPLADIGDRARASATAYAHLLVQKLRQEQQGKGGVDALLNEFSLSSEEGVALMCLAEALLRVPDAATADKLIHDKLKGGDWETHLGHSASLFVNASAWGLLFSGKMVNYTRAQQHTLHNTLQRTVARLGQNVVRVVVRRAIAVMGDVFVMGHDIQAAITRAERQEANGYRYSYDMLGEGARTAAAAETYFSAYEAAIHAIGSRAAGSGPERSAGISVKLSALHPRYELANKVRVMRELVPHVLRLAMLAKHYDIGFTVDAEEAARLDISLDVVEAVFSDHALSGWFGFGVAVQAYQKRAPQVIDWLLALAQRCGRRMTLRLVKGAYWDTEIKHAQVGGLAGYPVFTRKPATDVCYQACARKLLAHREHLFPQFATHNAWTVASILAMDETGRGYEFQRLHGMGEALYQHVMEDRGIACRIYAPVGEHTDLLAYLVRRLLENGANSSFVNNIVDDHVPIDLLVADPVVAVRQWSSCDNPKIPMPAALYGASRRNSSGIDGSDIVQLRALLAALKVSADASFASAAGEPVHNPASKHDIVGYLKFDSARTMQQKLAVVQQGFERQSYQSQQRAGWLTNFADILERQRGELVALCVREAGKTLRDGVAEVREAVDFCRYYAAQCAAMPERQLPLGVVLCISPWNFPLAIFVGQIAAAIAAGNAVLAKPAEQTSLVAQRAVALMYEAGLPFQLLQYVIARGVDAGATLIPDTRIKAVIFTGSTVTGRWLFEKLSERRDAPVPLIAETGGQNCMIVDSTALPEQVVDDVIRSGFASAGQRCSALRVLYLQEDVADSLITLIGGAMDELRIGDPAAPDTDVGPVIDAPARQKLYAHVAAMRRRADVRLLHQLSVSDERLADGHYFAPRLYEIPSLGVLPGEVFGPVIHIIRYSADQLEDVVRQINDAGYGLTLGVHSRIEEAAEMIAGRALAGNIYINRDMIGAVVGVQPFGGRGLSGTGPKAGGPLYLNRLSRLAGSTAVDKPKPEPGWLAGVTGETNHYLLEPRGVIQLLYGEQDNAEHCLASLLAAYDTGNTVLVDAPTVWHEHLAGSVAGNADRVQFRAGAGHLPEKAADAYVLEPGSALLPEVLDCLRVTGTEIPILICELPGPLYWQRFVAEKVITTNTTAAGGNAPLIASP